MISDFLAENNSCGQNLLSIVSKGNSIVGKLLKIKDNIPTIFRFDSKYENQKYSEVIIDLKYFSETEKFEAKIQRNPVLEELDDEIRETYAEILKDFYSLFESIYKYGIEMNKYAEDVQDGYYIQMSLESILWDVEGKQLLVEMLYLYGVMLLLIDKFVDGPIRERLLTSYYRYSAHQLSSDIHIDDVCKLLRSANKKSKTYPQDLFGRLQPNHTLVQLVIGRLRSDDIYNQLGIFPLPEHRTTALSSQASMLVVILNFVPWVLREESGTMREICDKYFNDNYVIPIYLGESINLVEFWSDGFPSAKSALDTCLSIKKISAVHSIKIKKQKDELKTWLKEGALTEENILETSNKLIELLRDSNVTLRWIFLHTSTFSSETGTKKSKQMRDQILQESNLQPETILEQLILIAQVELKVNELYKKLLREKEKNWKSFQTEAKERIEELAEVFNGTKPLSRVQKNEALSEWLKTKANQISALDFEKANSSRRKTIELIKAFNEMLEYHNLETLVQVKDWISETTACLHRMWKTSTINEDTLMTLQIIGDIAYAWGSLIDTLTRHMQQLIGNDPFAVSKLRAVFLKLSSAMDLPLLRLNQSKSKDLVEVSTFYSDELLKYVQKVLQIIPENIFNLLDEIIELETHSVKELPTRLDKEKVKEYAQLEARHKISRLTHDMSILTQGILTMKTTLVGIITIDPGLVLENGIRKELIRQLISSFYVPLFNNQHSKSPTTVEGKLEKIAKRIDGIRRSFEYIGDYINLNSLKIYQEEFKRLICFIIEQECNQWKKIKILPFQSDYQKRDVPILLPFVEEEGIFTFLGKILKELVILIDPKVSLHLNGSWYDSKSQVSKLTPNTFKLMEEALDISGLAGMDFLLSFHIQAEIKKLVKIYEKESKDNLITLSSFHEELSTSTIVHDLSSYNSHLTRFSKTSTIPVLVYIGQLQTFRERIQYQLRISANLNAKSTYALLSVTNRLMCLSLELENQEKIEFKEVFAAQIADSSLPFGLGAYPIGKIYVTLNPIQYVPLIISLSTIQHLKKLQYSKLLSALIGRKGNDGLDTISFLKGICTFLNQLHPSVTFAFLAYFSQYINSFIIHLNSYQFVKRDEELQSYFHFLKLILKYHGRKVEIEKFLRFSLPSFDLIPSLLNLIS